ncbi:MAG: VOC family protein [Bacteroidetes bacterium]|nr:MAG: VOC family protein [Bacteroidota bacterium]
MPISITKADFAPQLFIPSGVRNVDFYVDGLGATELRRFSNDDGSVHVVEYALGGSLFHLHEEKPSDGHYDPVATNGVTALVGVFVDDVDGLMNQAIKAGATLVKEAQDYEYGYRQGEIKDPFGHIWLIEKKID